MIKTITAIFGIAVFAAVLFGSAVLAPQAFAGASAPPAPPAPNEAGKVVICHNGDDGPETIEVSGNSVQKHIDNHGDTVGPCILGPGGPLKITSCECEGGEIEPDETFCFDLPDDNAEGAAFCQGLCEDEGLGDFLFGSVSDDPACEGT